MKMVKHGFCFWGAAFFGVLPAAFWLGPSRSDGAPGLQVAEVLMRTEQLLDEGQVEAARQRWNELGELKGANAMGLAFLEARAKGLEGQPEAAERGFSKLLEAPEGSDAIWTRATIALAESQRARGSLREALHVLTQALSSERAQAVLDPIYRKYVELLRTLPEGSEGELREWSRSGGEEKKGAARFYLAWMSHERGHMDRAMGEWRLFAKEFPEHRLRVEAVARICGWHLQRGEFQVVVDLAREALKGASGSAWTGALRLRLAVGWFGLERWEEAEREFLSVAESNPEVRPEAFFNAGLAALRAGREGEAESIIQKLWQLKGGGEFGADLEIEWILKRLNAGGDGGEEWVRSFESRNPDSPRLGELRLALAEWGFVRLQGVDGAEERRLWVERSKEWLAKVRSASSEESMAARVDYVGLLLELEGEVPLGRVLELGEMFLRNHPESSLGLDVRMRLGDACHRGRNFLGAEIWYATVERLEPGGRWAERALFLAGNNAAELSNPGSVDRALMYWNRVVAGRGELKWDARYQQAAVKSRLGGEEEALILFDLILEAGAAVKPSLRWRAWCGKADALWSLGRRSGRVDPRALKEYRALAEAEGVPAYWRNQALYKMAKAREAEDRWAALREFSLVLEAPRSREEGEFFWRFKAGFEAAGILEREQLWREAVRLYEGMAEEKGPRSEEAGLQAQRVRLEHFLWE